MPGRSSHSSSPPFSQYQSLLALRREAAAHALSMSEETFDKHVRPSLPVVRLGSVRVYPVSLLERWLIEHAYVPAEELERDPERAS